ncbi:putative RNA recognition motif domain, nucleotide-binding alpha-beta plait domain superfamily [Helianthus annuus]|uniref:RNA recognition motif domain, nucleotide-binding alpha-beta plait domain superfamily n=1 Tax=Helianthus annuus TaxID=4232 RepID=A0A9K3IY45_HELAN|nr:putative RNA recognition motif domain, nucleotide-binding alpha-beta plait domain superfamily [Helianthus annuus]
MASRIGREGGYDDGGPWSNVQYRKNRKSKGDGIEWTFLVQNLSDRVSRNLLWRAFQPFGYVSDVYVARKRDARGRCFGFVRYMGIVDVKETLLKLNTVKMFDMKVLVSLAKYDKDHKRFNYAPENLGQSAWRPKGNAQDGGQPQVEKQASGNTTSGPSYVQEGRSFADMLRRNNENQHNGAKVVNVKGKGSLYPLHCIGRSIIGDTKEVMSIGKVRLFLEEADLTDVGLSYVGGVTFLLTFKDKPIALECMNSHSALFNKIFSKFYLWTGEDIPFYRVATINIVGVPFIIRDSSIFDRIGGLFGEVIKQSEFSWQNEDNSLGSVSVLTHQKSRIEEAVVIKWNDKSIPVWVSESPGQYLNNLNCDLRLEDSDSELVSDSDPDESLEDEEDVEDGEIRPSNHSNVGNQEVHQSPVPELGENSPAGVKIDNPVGKDKSPVDQGSPFHEESPTFDVNMGNNVLHGEENMTADKVCNNEGDLGNRNGSIKKGGGYYGPNEPGPDVGVSQPNFELGEDGPTPIISLGKRNRDDRSPPSIGSMQGPSQKIFGMPNKSGSVSLDLNSPLVEVSGNEENAFEDLGAGGTDSLNQEVVEPVEVTVQAQESNEVRIEDANLRNEVEATVQVGAMIGVDLSGFLSATEELIVKEGEENCFR